MPTQIDRDAFVLLDALTSEPRESYVGAAELTQKTGLDPGRVNDAMSILVDAGLAEWLQSMGTAPYDFGEAMVTPRGRYEHQRVADARDATKSGSPSHTDTMAAVAATAIHPPSPVGSPYGFTDEELGDRRGAEGTAEPA